MHDAGKWYANGWMARVCVIMGLVSLQCAGAGKMKPNVLMIGFKNNWLKAPPEEVNEYFMMIQLVYLPPPRCFTLFL